MGIETMLIVSAVSTVASGVMQYAQQKKADKAEKAAYAESLRIANEQSALDKADADRAAQAELDDAEKTRKLQKMLYLKSGVDLTGSPLLVMEETRKKGEENAQNIRDSQAARSNLAIQSAAANKPISRASLIGTAADVTKGVAGSYTDYSILKKQLTPATPAKK